MEVGFQGGLDVATQAKTEGFSGILSTRRKGGQSVLCVVVMQQVILVLVMELLGVKGLTQSARGRHGGCGWVWVVCLGTQCFCFCLSAMVSCDESFLMSPFEKGNKFSGKREQVGNRDEENRLDGF